MPARPAGAPERRLTGVAREPGLAELFARAGRGDEFKAYAAEVRACHTPKRNLMTLFDAPQRLTDMASAAHAAGRPDAAARLADLVGELTAVPALAPSGVAA